MERLVILGGGESGVGTAILGKKKGFKILAEQVTIKGKIKIDDKMEEYIVRADYLVKYKTALSEYVLIR